MSDLNRWIQENPRPADNAVAKLLHTVTACGNNPEWAVIATGNVYGEQVTTGLTYADLHELGQLITSLPTFSLFPLHRLDFTVVVPDGVDVAKVREVLATQAGLGRAVRPRKVYVGSTFWDAAIAESGLGDRVRSVDAVFTIAADLDPDWPELAVGELAEAGLPGVWIGRVEA